MEMEIIDNPVIFSDGEGRITFFMPAFEEEPKSPVIKKQDEETLCFIRSAQNQCLLKNVGSEMIEAICRVQRVLVLEIDLADSTEALNAELENNFKRLRGQEVCEKQNMMDVIENLTKRIYEAFIVT